MCKIKERPVGDVFPYNGKTFQVRRAFVDKGGNDTCDGCYFNDHDDCNELDNIIGLCSASSRSDDGVIFVEINPEGGVR